MALPSNNGIFIHEGLNCSPVVVPTAQSIPLSPSDSTTVKTAVDTTLSNIAEDYDATSTYAVGDCVLYQRVLYQCTTAIPTAEAWNSAHWTAVKAVDVGSGGGGGTAATTTYDNTESGLSADNVQEAIDEVVEEKADRVPEPAEYSATSTYNVGDFCTHDNNIYLCSNKITTPEVWTSNHWTLCNAQQDYLHSLNPVGNGSFSLNRKNGTTIGELSFAGGANVTASGYISHAEGNNTVASGSYSHAEGFVTTASGTCSHAEGYNTTASSSYSHTEGYSTTASGNYSHAEGDSTTASGQSAHAEGTGTLASVRYSHAEGLNTSASGQSAHAEGQNTFANHRSQHVFGEYNVADTSSATVNDRGNYAEIVGNGTADNVRSNARTLDWSGNEVLAGGLKINGTEDVATQSILSAVATSGDYNDLLNKPITFGGIITDLNVERSATTFRIYLFNGGSANSPSGSAGGWLIHMVNDNTRNYGSQIASTNSGLYFRKISGGTYQAWTTISS